MSMTLLEVTQEILSSMDADEINSIGDTVEATQVVDAIVATWRDLQVYIDLPQYDQLFELTGPTDVSKPTQLSIPDDVRRVDCIKYDMTIDETTIAGTVRNWVEVLPLVRGEFFDRMNSLDSTSTNVYNYNLVIGTGTFDVRGYKNKYPTHYTIVNDKTILFDNYPDQIEPTLVANKTQCNGLVIPTFSRTDNWVIPLEDNALSLFVNEAKSQAFIDLKQVQNTKADSRARRALLELRRTGDRDNLDVPAIRKNVMNFGRRGSF